MREIVQHMKKTRGEGNLMVCDGFDELSRKERTQTHGWEKRKDYNVGKNLTVPYCSQSLKHYSHLYCPLLSKGMSAGIITLLIKELDKDAARLC